MSAPLSSKPAATTVRVAQFSDGVFAIAITLLIFGIKIPIAAPHDAGELKRQLWALWPAYLDFGASFAIIGVFWIGHHQMFQLITHTDRTFLWLNNAFLMCVAFITFPTSLLDEYFNQRVAVVFYGATISATGMFFYILWTYTSARGRLLYPDTPSRVVKVFSRRILIGVVLYCLAIAIAFMSLTAIRILLFLSPLFYLIPSSIDRYIDT